MLITLKNYAYLIRLDKPIGILLLLWPTLWGLWLAGEGDPQFKHVVYFILGVIIMRSAGCIINDIADRNFDPHVERTRERPIAAKKISVAQASIAFFLLMTAAFLIVLQLPMYVIELSFAGAALTMIYPFLKRLTHLPQLGLGFAFAWGVPMAFAAEQNELPAITWFLFAAAVLWPIMYDTLYAMADINDDKKIGVKSSAILFGKFDRLIIFLLQLAFLLCMLCVGVLGEMRWPFYLSLVISELFFAYQNMLIKTRDPHKCFTAFKNNHWVGLIIFSGIIMSYIT